MSLRNVVSRRTLLAVASTVGLAGLPARARAQATPISGTPDAATFPVTITHAFGETTIPAPPQRIVLTDEHEGLDALLALGIEPVGMVQGGGYIGGLAPWAIALGAGEIPTIASLPDGEFDFEAFAVERPDLILASWIDEDAYEVFSSIAPTLMIKNADATTWQDIQRMIGAATGRSADAEAVVAETEALISSQEERLTPYLDKTVAVAYFWFDQFLVNGKDAPIGRILADYGMDVISPGVAAVGEIDMLSMEQINAVAEADILIAADFLPDQTAAQEASELYRALPAVQNGGYVLLSPEMAQALYVESALSMQWGAPRLVDAVIEGAEGRGQRLEG